MCELPKKYQQPVLVSGTDGVGTKLRLALDLNRHNTIGIDLVAMCVNDLIVQGAEPLFFLDYYATGKLEVDVAAQVVEGIGEGCQKAGCALIGGETAEMPGMYHANDYDVAGFCVGVVEKENIIDGSRVNAGDTLIALGSSGPHSNGYSLIRKILAHANANLEDVLESQTLADWLMAPTKIYVQSILKLIEQFDIHAISHITGGGFWENIPRVLPPNTQAVINRSSWTWSPIFQWLQTQGNVSDHEMFRTFNCGVGLIIALPKSQAIEAIEFLKAQQENAWIIGHIRSVDSHEDRVCIVE